MKTKYISVRVSESEYEKIKQIAQAEKISVSDLLRKNLLKQRPRQTEEKKNLQKIQTHLGRIGNNLNQIARWVNTFKGASEALNIMLALHEIKAELEKWPS